MLNYFNFFNEDPIVALLLVIAGIVAPHTYKIFVILLFVLLIWFYRSPLIDLKHLQSNEVYSPAYGIIEHIEHINGQYKIAILLSIFDIHIQYFPVYGDVIHQIRTPRSVSTIMNNIMWGHPESDRLIKITQRIGYIARRIATPEIRGTVSAGSRLGMIKFGSHVDLEISDKYKLTIKPGDYVYGPYTKVAEWTP